MNGRAFSNNPNKRGESQHLFRCQLAWRLSFSPSTDRQAERRTDRQIDRQTDGDKSGAWLLTVELSEEVSVSVARCRRTLFHQMGLLFYVFKGVLRLAVFVENQAAMVPLKHYSPDARRSIADMRQNKQSIAGRGQY